MNHSLELPNKNEKLSCRQEDLLCKQYETLVDLYKFYLTLALNTNIFSYAITGGILSFYFKEQATIAEQQIVQNVDILQFSLVLPIIYSILFGFLSFRGSYLLKKNVQDHIYKICESIKLLKAPDMGTAVIFLRISSIIYFCVAIAMTSLIDYSLLKSSLICLELLGIIISLTKWYMWKTNKNPQKNKRHRAWRFSK